MKIGTIHREVAKLLWEGDLTIEQIALKYNRSDRAIYRWKNDPDFNAVLTEIEENHKTQAKRESIRWARRSVKTLIKLQDYAAIKNEKGDIVGEEFKFGADVARKAACDLLEMAEVKIDKIQGEGFGSSTLLVIRSGNGDRSAEGQEAEAVSGRLRFQPFRIPRNGSGLGSG
jgi:hypothetical protein